MSSPGARHSASRAKMPPPCASGATSPPALELTPLPHLPGILHPIQVEYGRSHRRRAQGARHSALCAKSSPPCAFRATSPPGLELTPLPHLPGIPHPIQVEYGRSHRRRAQGARHSALCAKSSPPCAFRATSPPALELAPLPHLPGIPHPIQVEYGRSH
jgi:hypothetical protein